MPRTNSFGGPSYARPNAGCSGRMEGIGSRHNRKRLTLNTQRAWDEWLSENVACSHEQQVAGFGLENRRGVHNARVGFQKISGSVRLAKLDHARAVASQFR